MAVYGEDKKTTVDLEELLEMMRRQDKKRPVYPKEDAPEKTRRREGPQEKAKQKNFPVTTLVLVALVIALGTMVTILKTEITSMKSEISELKNLKTQMNSIDPKLEIASLETKIEKKLEESNKDREKIKADLARMTADIEVLKAPRKKGK
jgi:septal ring factor EnvC (AmiA/AmiB activator)